MKISKDDLLELIRSDGDLEHVSRVEVVLALQDNDLEIEGYVRRDAAKMVDEWTRFDPNDTKTFPPCKGMYLVCRCVEPYFREAKFYGEKVGFGDTCVILWRPLPKPPQEETK